MSIEHILASVWSTRRPQRTKTQCFTCGANARFYRESEKEVRLCSAECNNTQFFFSQILQLGMKRKSEMGQIQTTGFWSLPPELQGAIILMAHDYRVKSMEEWKNLMEIENMMVDAGHIFGAVLKEHIIPYLKKVTTEVLQTLSIDVLLLFTGLTSFKLNKSFSVDVTKLVSLKNITSLDISEAEIKNLKEWTHLKILITQRSTKDNHIQTLTNLTSLSIAENNTSLTIESLSRLTNLTRLDFARGSGKKILGNGYLVKLPKLQSLLLRSQFATNIDVKHLKTNLTHLLLSDTPVNSIRKLTNLTQLTISRQTNIESRHLYRLTKLESLNLLFITGSENLNDIGSALPRLKNLTGLSLRGSEMQADSYLKYVTNIRSLDIERCESITDDGLMYLTNLTQLDMYKARNITMESIKKLPNLTWIRIDMNNYEVSSYSLRDLQLPNLTIVNDR